MGMGELVVLMEVEVLCVQVMVLLVVVVAMGKVQAAPPACSSRGVARRPVWLLPRPDWGDGTMDGRHHALVVHHLWMARPCQACVAGSSQRGTRGGLHGRWARLYCPWCARAHGGANSKQQRPLCVHTNTRACMLWVWVSLPTSA